MAVKELVVIISEINHAISHAECPAAVFMHAGAGVEGWRYYVIDVSVGGSPDDDVASSFPWALLHPLDGFIVYG